MSPRGIVGRVTGGEVTGGPGAEVETDEPDVVVDELGED
jgi:hypothetical protein